MLRLLRGRARIRLHYTERGEYALPSGIIVPANVDPNRNASHAPFQSREGSDRPEKRIHRGTIEALGPPAYEYESKGIERPWHVKEGDEVFFVFAKALERVRSFGDVVYVAQEEIQACIPTDSQSSQSETGTTQEAATP